MCNVQPLGTLACDAHCTLHIDKQSPMGLPAIRKRERPAEASGRKSFLTDLKECGLLAAVLARARSVLGLAGAP